MNDFSLGRVFGFPLSVQPSALFILALFVLLGAEDGAASMGRGVLFALAVFASILVHELGHAFVARFYKLGPISITLHGFGGFTRFRRAPDPKQGLLVTLAGPGASLALGAGALVAAFVGGEWTAAGGLVSDDLVWRAATLNVFWGLFNLLPMYPLDGGLITWHGLSFFRPREVALQWAARVGVLVAVFVGTMAVLAGQFFIAIVAGLSLVQSAPLAFERPRA